MLHFSIYTILLLLPTFFFPSVKKINKSVNNTTGEAPPRARDLSKGSSSGCVRMSETFVGAFSLSEDPRRSLDQGTAFHWSTSRQPRGLVHRGGACRWVLRCGSPHWLRASSVTRVAPVLRAGGLSEVPGGPPRDRLCQPPLTLPLLTI